MLSVSMALRPVSNEMKPKELAPPYQRLQQRRKEEAERLKRIADALKRNTENQDRALTRWANPMK